MNDYRLRSSVRWTEGEIGPVSRRRIFLARSSDSTVADKQKPQSAAICREFSGWDLRRRDPDPQSDRESGEEVDAASRDYSWSPRKSTTPRFSNRAINGSRPGRRIIARTSNGRYIRPLATPSHSAHR